MPRCLGVLVVLLAVPTARAEPGTPPAVKFGPVPALLYHQLPALPAGQGVVLEELSPGSQLYEAGLRRFDILLEYAGTQLKDGAQFLGLFGSAAADVPRPLVLFRRGQRTTLTLVRQAGADPLLKALVKPGGPPAVTVDAQPLQDGKLKVTFVYYSDNSGKLESVTCSGSLGDIEREVRHLGEQQRMSARVQDLMDVALKRIRTLNEPESR